jgi:hypothetical protein
VSVLAAFSIAGVVAGAITLRRRLVK